ncbi:unnamed protein product [Ostreobium quekettii]|uniref:Uncharacterized protein n=1 Tax=Ostreobium quekettii TaxID=121088 RepID=A0A8S1J3B0_9CHLO|nr:unnamed protein product [Ostreobium quekettii]
MSSKLGLVNRGIVGYTGAIPNASCYLLETKGSTKRTGLALADSPKNEGQESVNNSHIVSLYRNHYGAYTGYQRPNKEGGGYWFSQRALGDALPFTAVSTYTAEIDQSGQKALGSLKAGRTSAEGLSEGCPSRGSSPTKTSVPSWNGEALGYQTEYGSMVMKDALTGGAVSPGCTRSRKDTEEGDGNRFKVLPHAMLPRIQTSTTYHDNYGTCGSDPLARSAPNEQEMTRTASTINLAHGTPRNTYHIPGYGGFIPESTHNKLAVTQAEGQHTRIDAKIDMLLSTSVDQYSRGRLPGYTGCRPRDSKNIKIDQMPRGLPLDVDGMANTPGGRKGVMSFFTGGPGNGEAEAQLYYHDLKPLEGLPKIEVPSKTTLYGARFNG